MRFRKGCFEVVISRHAFERAMQRGIHPDLIESCLQTGRVERFGKNNFKIVKDFRKFSVICVDEMIGSAIKIVTIEKKWKL
ncbi:MAG TPA: DUF4258 domain-containing protein [Candidatus Diapherotrites archaeon]|uniref:DUF4258 domain-containing protein n=1 Tax=Candidatus Iainarchaeum sp. TaxID=3101447 RepID=A0A7J4JU15_9ARCH|nr:DUF4258 domain-containing protein [Candidatus Diapherotrites archaeon]